MPRYDQRDISFDVPDCDAVLTDRAMSSMLEHYTPNVADRRDPRLSVIGSPSLAAMPPTYVATAGMDVLRDQGLAFAVRLRSSGVAVEERCFRNLPHAFSSALVEPHARAATAEAVRALAAGLAVGPRVSDAAGERL